MPLCPDAAGGRLTKLYGLDVKEIDSTDGTLSFVKIDKNADRLLKTLYGRVAKSFLRMSALFPYPRNDTTKILAVEPRTRPRELALLRSRGHVLSHSCGHVLSRSRGV